MNDVKIRRRKNKFAVMRLSVGSRYFRCQRYASVTEGHAIGVQCYCIVNLAF